MSPTSTSCCHTTPPVSTTTHTTLPHKHGPHGQPPSAGTPPGSTSSQPTGSPKFERSGEQRHESPPKTPRRQVLHRLLHTSSDNRRARGAALGFRCGTRTPPPSAPAARTVSCRRRVTPDPRDARPATCCPSCAAPRAPRRPPPRSPGRTGRQPGSAASRSPRPARAPAVAAVVGGGHERVGPHRECAPRAERRGPPGHRGSRRRPSPSWWCRIAGAQSASSGILLMAPFRPGTAPRSRWPAAPAQLVASPIAVPQAYSARTPLKAPEWP